MYYVYVTAINAVRVVFRSVRVVWLAVLGRIAVLRT